MLFPYDVYLPAVLGAGLTTAATLPLWRTWCCRTGLVDDPGERKIHATPIPLAGGLAVMSGLLLPLLAGIVILAWRSGGTTVFNATVTGLLEHGLGRRGMELGGVMLGALIMLAIGLLDDKIELRPAMKFGGQVLAALITAAAGARVTLFVPSLLFSYAITVLWILTVVNAFNFMDNMNGLCAGLGAIGAWYFALVAAADGQYLVGIIALLVAGALLGFLPYNFPNATAFLGDSGSHLVGFLLAMLAILPHFYTPQHRQPLAVLIPLLVLAVPLGDLAWVVVLRWRLGKPFYMGDNNHLSHRLVRRGHSKTQAVLLIWLLAAAAGALAFLVT